MVARVAWLEDFKKSRLFIENQKLDGPIEEVA